MVSMKLGPASLHGLRTRLRDQINGPQATDVDDGKDLEITIEYSTNISHVHAQILFVSLRFASDPCASRSRAAVHKPRLAMCRSRLVLSWSGSKAEGSNICQLPIHPCFHVRTSLKFARKST